MVTIKKYRNRRLYDTASSRYVKLEDVAEMVRKGEELEVIDVNSGEDITRMVLTQIIVEGARDTDQGLPIEFLRQMIATTGRGRHELMSRYSNFVAGLYQRAQEEIRERFQQDGTTPTPGLVNPLEVFQKYLQPDGLDSLWSKRGSTGAATEAPESTPEPNASSPEPVASPDDAVAELQALRAKLEAIEQSIQPSTTVSVPETEEETR